MQRGSYTRARIARKQNVLLPKLIAIGAIALAVVIISLAVSLFISRAVHGVATVSSLYKLWDEKLYQEVYDTSDAILSKKPLQNVARTFHGYSAFQLALSETDSTKSQNFLDEAMINLRVALNTAKRDVQPQISYMLGKTYFYKDNAANYHYYADLAIKYLLRCQKGGYEASDIPLYLGLSYAALGETQKSIEAFGAALLVRESDTLFLSLAEQYYKMENISASRSYLALVSKVSQNDEILERSHILQGQMYLKEEKYTDAKTEFDAVLAKNENSADAHYGLCLLYDKLGDKAKFRSELRTCLRIQPNHSGALALSER